MWVVAGQHLRAWFMTIQKPAAKKAQKRCLKGTCKRMPMRAMIAYMKVSRTSNAPAGRMRGENFLILQNW